MPQSTPSAPAPQPPNHKPRKSIYHRMRKSILFTLVFLGASLGFGMWGYHHYAELNWVDSFVNAAMILSGMGPVSPLDSDSSKIFAGCYALYSGGAFLIAIAVVLAPILHHFLKSFEMESPDKQNLK